jgi:predicted Zn-ribbon and HTH transcriptional regulator
MMALEDVMPKTRVVVPKPPKETPHEVVAAYFEECSRLLRAHPELFDAEALSRVGVVAGLSARVTRMAARGEPTLSIVRDVGSTLLLGIAQVAGMRPGSMRPGSKPSTYDRATLLLLAGVRRGYVRAAQHVLPGPVEERVDVFEDAARPRVSSACPRCDDRVVRDLASPAPCAKCGFVFAAVN